MPRTAVALTPTGNLVREAVDTPGLVSQNLEVQLTVKASDLLAALTAAEKTTYIDSAGAGRIIFAVGFTDDAGNLIHVGSTYPESTALSRVAPTVHQLKALRNLILHGAADRSPSFD